MDGSRQILHIDMNAFYASCHAADEPTKYKGRAIAVAGSPETRHGIIVTASYEARAQGVRTTMTVPEALRLCPGLLFIKPNFALYRAYARKVFDIVYRFTPLVEIVSIDECYADVTGSSQFGNGKQIAKTIQETIRDELHLPCSIGISDCKFFAKMGSNLKKPMGMSVVDSSNYQRVLWGLNVEEMHGVGAKTAAKLQAIKIHSIGQLAVASDGMLERLFGVRGVELKRFANGKDGRPVVSERAPAKSIGHSITLPKDVQDLEALRRVILNLADQVGRRVRKHEFVARVLCLTIRYSNLETVTKRASLPYASDLTEHFYHSALSLLQKHWKQERGIRLVGLTVSDFAKRNDQIQAEIQTDLFNAKSQQIEFLQNERLEKLTKATDVLRNRFGEDIVVRGRMLQQDDSNALRNHQSRGTSLQTDQLFEKE
jgi:DNA polymerase IV